MHLGIFEIMVYLGFGKFGTHIYFDVVIRKTASRPGPDPRRPVISSLESGATRTNPDFITKSGNRRGTIRRKHNARIIKKRTKLCLINKEILKTSSSYTICTIFMLKINVLVITAIIMGSVAV